ncbi:MAG: hypothetical protein IPG76_09645 [Acidobacteria bacterium]|nr:hypothetical protein [Acidobacteriota bacterium]
MPIRQVPNENQNYYLINYDDKGKERSADDGSLLSAIVVKEIAETPVTDVFLMSHGWLGDINDAQAQYDKWMANLLSCKKDIEKMKVVRPGFKPLLIGLHWPSKPFADEDNQGAFSTDLTANIDQDKMINDAIERDMRILAAPAKVRTQLRKIYKAYLELDNPDSLPDAIQRAYKSIDDALRIDNTEREPFDPDQIYQNALDSDKQDMEAGSFGGFSFGNLLAPLRVLSFWRMKDRARKFGESGGSDLLRQLQKASSKRNVRYHLMGHSFGCIVMSAIAAGPQKATPDQKPINSMMLVQGAMSIWAYCPSFPFDKKKGGYFNSALKNKRITGPLLTTQSEHDKAVGCFYPLGAGIKRQVDYAVELPKYAAIGTYGIQGLDDMTDSVTLGNVDHDYQFKPGRVYNIESSNMISKKVIGVGAHSDITHPEIAHAWWQAAMAG